MNSKEKKGKFYIYLICAALICILLARCTLPGAIDENFIEFTNNEIPRSDGNEETNGHILTPGYTEGVPPDIANTGVDGDDIYIEHKRLGKNEDINGVAYASNSDNIYIGPGVKLITTTGTGQWTILVEEGASHGNLSLIVSASSKGDYIINVVINGPGTYVIGNGGGGNSSINNIKVGFFTDNNQHLYQHQVNPYETTAPETTTKTPETTTTKAPETTTKTPETTTTKAPETTTPAPETTTSAPDIITRAPETTTAPPALPPPIPLPPETTITAETTTAPPVIPPPQETTTAPETTTPEPETTTNLSVVTTPEETTIAPETTTPEETTVAPPVTTTETTTPTTTPEPVVITPAPDTTTPVPETTTPAPEPETTISEPEETTIPEPVINPPEITAVPEPEVSEPAILVPDNTTPEPPEITAPAPEITETIPPVPETPAPELEPITTGEYFYLLATAIPLNNGWFAEDLGEGWYFIMDDIGIPLGYILLSEDESIEDFDVELNLIPLSVIEAEFYKTINSQTGDKNNIFILSVLFILSGCVIIKIKNKRLVS